ncbi:MAG TPA: hypothetical protein VGJ84_09925 [Polyangiaceae bacterium]
MTTVRYVFVREPGSRHGELHRERAGIVKIVAKAYLNIEGWLLCSGDFWLRPGTFSVRYASIPQSQVSLPLERLLVQSMRHARKLLGAKRFQAPLAGRAPNSTERDRALSA